MMKKPKFKRGMTDKQLDELDAQLEAAREKAGCIYCGGKVVKGQNTCNDHLIAGFLAQIQDELMDIKMALDSTLSVSIESEIDFDKLGIDLGIDDDDGKPWDCTECDKPIPFGEPYINLSVTEEVMQHANDPITVIGAESIGTWHKKCSPHKAPEPCLDEPEEEIPKMGAVVASASEPEEEKEEPDATAS